MTRYELNFKRKFKGSLMPQGTVDDDRSIWSEYDIE
jgi:hypothetical protein